jgi:hypothetical protein
MEYFPFLGNYPKIKEPTNASSSIITQAHFFTGEEQCLDFLVNLAVEYLDD